MRANGKTINGFQQHIKQKVKYILEIHLPFICCLAYPVGRHPMLTSLEAADVLEGHFYFAMHRFRERFENPQPIDKGG